MRKYEFKLLVLLLLLVALPCILLSSFAIQALGGQKVIIEKKIEQSYAVLAANVGKQIIHSMQQRIKTLDTIFAKPGVWQPAPPFALWSSVLKDPLWKRMYVLDSEWNIIYPTERPQPESSSETWTIAENFPLFENAYVWEFSKKDFETAIVEYQKVVAGFQEQNLAPLGHALLGIGRCHLKLGRTDQAIETYNSLITLFRNRPDGVSLGFVIDARLQITEIAKLRKEMLSYYQTLLELMEMLMQYEYCFSKSQYIYYFRRIQTALESLSQNSYLATAEQENLQRKQEEILENHKVLINQEKELKSIRRYGIAVWKAQPRSLIPDSGYLNYSVENNPQLVYYRRLEMDSFVGYVLYSIDLQYCLQDMVLPVLQSQVLEKDVGLILLNSESMPILGNLDPPSFSIVTQSLDPIFPFWQVGVYLSNVHSLEELSHYQSQLHFLGILTLILVLIVGVYVVISTFLREIQSARFKSDFVSHITHELKTPLTAIKMFVDTLLMGRAKNPEEQSECLGVIAAESDRLSELIDRILNFAKMQQKKRIFKFRQVQIVLLVQEWLQQFQKQLPETPPCRLQLSLEPELPNILVDQEIMRECILNLLSNAYKYNDKPMREIEVKVEKREHDRIAIIVKDNGIGIPRHEFHRIFEKFYRGQNSMTQKTPGSGLGLALVSSIVKAHKGKIELQSKVGIGSEFTILLNIPKT